MLQILTDNHYETILDLFDSVQKRIVIISPFLSKSMAEKLCNAVRTKKVSCIFITRLYLQDLIAKATSIEALRMMKNCGIQVFLLKGLHTKLYLFDEKSAIVGSANFTAGGFKTNVELSLFIEDEPSVINDLCKYCFQLLDELSSKGGQLTDSILSAADSAYQDLWAANKGTIVTKSDRMYGVSLGRKDSFENTTEIVRELNRCSGESESDIVYRFFANSEQREQIILEHNIWMKFSGEGNDRLDPDKPLSIPQVTLNNNRVFISNYSRKPSSVNDGDEIYFAALTTDYKGKNQPVIVGRGHLRAFSDKNEITTAWLNDYPWMIKYPWFVVINDGEIINTSVKHGIPLDTVWQALGSDTYFISFGRNESIAEVASKHHQKAHLRLSGNAKELIDQHLNELLERYGRQKITSE